MKTYTYKFVNNTQADVEVSDEMYELLRQMDRDEYNNWQRENRRHVSAERVVGTEAEPATSDDYLLDELLGKMENETLQKALNSLTAAQQRLVKQIFVERLTQKEVAESEHVHPVAIWNRLQKIYKKIQRFFG